MNELVLLGADTGSTIYALDQREDEKVLDTTAGTYVALVVADVDKYAIDLTETPAGSRRWMANLPEDSFDGQTHTIVYYQKSGSSRNLGTDLILGTEKIYTGDTSPLESPTGYISISEYKTAHPDTSMTDDKIQMLINQASALINGHLGKSYLNIARTEYYDGDGWGLLNLNQHPTSISKVTIGDTEYDGSLFRFTSGGTLYPLDTGPTFPEGYQNVKVEYTSGATGDDLQRLKWATIQLVHLMNELSDEERLVMTKSVKDVTVKYGNVVSAPDPENPLFYEIWQGLVGMGQSALVDF